jgi:predicted small integral membrane protein
MDTLEVAKIYVRHNTAIIALTSAVMFGAYLGQITESIWAAYILGVSGCVYIDRKSDPEA